MQCKEGSGGQGRSDLRLDRFMGCWRRWKRHLEREMGHEAVHLAVDYFSLSLRLCLCQRIVLLCVCCFIFVKIKEQRSQVDCCSLFSFWSSQIIHSLRTAKKGPSKCFSLKIWEETTTKAHRGKLRSTAQKERKKHKNQLLLLFVAKEKDNKKAKGIGQGGWQCVLKAIN